MVGIACDTKTVITHFDSVTAGVSKGHIWPVSQTLDLDAPVLHLLVLLGSSNCMGF